MEKNEKSSLFPTPFPATPVAVTLLAALQKCPKNRSLPSIHTLRVHSGPRGPLPGTLVVGCIGWIFCWAGIHSAPWPTLPPCAPTAASSCPFPSPLHRPRQCEWPQPPGAQICEAGRRRVSRTGWERSDATHSSASWVVVQEWSGETGKGRILNPEYTVR